MTLTLHLSKAERLELGAAAEQLGMSPSRFARWLVWLAVNGRILLKASAE